MGLMFSAKEIPERNVALTFDDVLIAPMHCEMDSRKTPDLKTRLTKNFNIDAPFIASNMDTVTETEMAKAMAMLGGIGILHRFMDLDQQVEQVKLIRTFLDENKLNSPISASIGVKEGGKRRADFLADCGIDILTLDIAHGDSAMMIDILDYVKTKYPQIDVIAGNVATPWGTKMLIEHGADAIKVGIGPGSMCTTRIITGCGVPQLTAVSICAQEAKKHDIPVIADGGIKRSGDVVKALSAGADSVMLGSILAGTMETPGEVKSGMKKYRGMASKDAQVSWRGDLPKGMAAEGESRLIACKGSVSNIIDELSGGLRSGMTYINALNIKDLYENALFMEMHSSGMMESKPHGMN
jgi:IMP dehydrogenase